MAHDIIVAYICFCTIIVLVRGKFDCAPWNLSCRERSLLGGSAGLTTYAYRSTDTYFLPQPRV